MSAAPEAFSEHRFELGASPGLRWHWHAVDAASLVRPRVGPENGIQHSVEVYSVCGQRAVHAPKLGGFTYDNKFLALGRCERCSWVVALNRGTVEQEIDFYTDAPAGCDVLAATGTASGLLRGIFTAILADAPPGPDAESGHRSDLLAHAAQHRPQVIACKHCRDARPAGVHDAPLCPHAAMVCGQCTFRAGSWAGMDAGAITGECVVEAPCSVLTALAHHYGATAT